MHQDTFLLFGLHCDGAVMQVQGKTARAMLNEKGDEREMILLQV